MGRQRTQAEKLKELRERLNAGKKIANRDIRAAFGKDDYGRYETELAELTAEMGGFSADMTERTAAQQEVERTITSWLSITSRVAKGAATQASADKKEEELGDLFAALTHEERAQMNYWKVDEATGAIVFNDDKTTKGLPIYRDFGESVENLKRTALRRAIDETIGSAEPQVDEAELKKRFDELKALKRR